MPLQNAVCKFLGEKGDRTNFKECHQNYNMKVLNSSAYNTNLFVNRLIGGIKYFIMGGNS